MSNDPNQDVWSFEDFTSRLGETLGLDLSSVTRETTIDDAGFDSLSLLTVVSWFAEMSIDLNDEYASWMENLGQLYEHYEVWTTRNVEQAQRGAGNSEEALSPSSGHETSRLVNERYRLRPLRPSDYPVLYETSFSNEDGYLWRFRGDTLSFEQFTGALWDQVLWNQAIEDAESGLFLGYVSLNRQDFRNGHAHLAVLLIPEARGRGWPLEAVAMAVKYIFEIWPFRKLYMTTFEFSYEQFSTGEGWWFEEEGLLREHEYHNGRYWDLHLLTVTREKFLSHYESLAQRRS